jgi:hypothetical protein
MPNWVDNTLTVEGSPEAVMQLKAQMNKPFKQSVQSLGDLAYELKEVSYSNPVFSFWNIVAPPADKLDEYHGTHGFENGQQVGETPYNWYNFNNREWGVKWDVAVSDDSQYSETQLINDEPNGENHVLVYRFRTPWGIPEEALCKLSAQYPTLLLTLEYEEEQGWGGSAEFLRGNFTSIGEYNWICWQCDYAETGDPDNNYCEDCEGLICPQCNHSNWVDVRCEKHKETANVL